MFHVLNNTGENRSVSGVSLLCFFQNCTLAYGSGSIRSTTPGDWLWFRHEGVGERKLLEHLCLLERKQGYSYQERHGVVKKGKTGTSHGWVVKSPLCNPGDVGSISGQGTKLLQALGQLSLHTTTRVCTKTKKPHMTQWRPTTSKQINIFKWKYFREEKIPEN